MEKKEISSRTATKGLINGFISYGILLIFIFFTLIIFVAWQVNQYKDYIDYDTLKLSLPILAAFLIFFLIRVICHLSTFDLFKKCKIKSTDVEKVWTRLNLFFIGCIIFSVLLVLLIINAKSYNEKTAIQEASDMYYSQFSEYYAEHLTLNMIDDYKESRSLFLIQSIIIETGLILGLFSLIPLQKKLIERYNSVEVKKKSSASKSGKHSKEAKSSAS